MADTIGLTTFPIAAPALSTDVVGDLALQRLGAFLQSSLNRMGNTAWRTRGASTANVVEHVFYRNPKRLFDERRLPALYLWRTSSKRAREADDLLKVTSRITIYWVSAPAQESHDIAREPFERAVDIMIARALHRERDPSWVVSGDTDPLAAAQGSFLPTWLGYSWLLKGDATELEMTADVHDGDGHRSVMFFGLATGVDIEEMAGWDRDEFTSVAALDLVVQQDGRAAGDIYDPEGNVVFFGGQHLRHEGVSVTYDG
jgi:hypothetical protein